jgi:hypothetical protein
VSGDLKLKTKFVMPEIRNPASMIDDDRASACFSLFFLEGTYLLQRKQVRGNGGSIDVIRETPWIPDNNIPE